MFTDGQIAKKKKKRKKPQPATDMGKSPKASLLASTWTGDKPQSRLGTEMQIILMRKYIKLVTMPENNTLSNSWSGRDTPQCSNFVLFFCLVRKGLSDNGLQCAGAPWGVQTCWCNWQILNASSKCTTRQPNTHSNASEPPWKQCVGCINLPLGWPSPLPAWRIDEPPGRRHGPTPQGPKEFAQEWALYHESEHQVAFWTKRSRAIHPTGRHLSILTLRESKKELCVHLVQQIIGRIAKFIGSQLGSPQCAERATC